MKPRSMEEKISYRLFWMGFVGLICTAARNTQRPMRPKPLIPTLMAMGKAPARVKRPFYPAPARAARPGDLIVVNMRPRPQADTCGSP